MNMTLRNVFFRNVTENDLELIFNWANEEAVRKNSFSKEYISYERHNQWFFNKMKNKGMFYILQQDDAVIGQIRVEK